MDYPVHHNGHPLRVALGQSRLAAYLKLASDQFRKSEIIAARLDFVAIVCV
jgi:hypothetical protein